jgi:6-phosphogluconolactonase
MIVLVLSEEELYQRAAELFVDSAEQSVESLGVFTVALSGGNTPKPLYSLLGEAYADRVPWRQTYIFFSDERCVPPDHVDSNFRTAEQALISKIDIPPENVHRMKGEMDPEAAAKEYADEITRVFNLKPGQVPSFDLILLGLGEDAHIASIFPGSDAIYSTSDMVAATYVPKLGAHRLTLTPPVIQSAKRTIVLATGEEKAEALKHAMEGPYEPDLYPAQLLRDAVGEVICLVDHAAASGLSAVAVPESYYELFLTTLSMAVVSIKGFIG